MEKEWHSYDLEQLSRYTLISSCNSSISWPNNLPSFPDNLVAIESNLISTFLYNFCCHLSNIWSWSTYFTSFSRRIQWAAFITLLLDHTIPLIWFSWLSSKAVHKDFRCCGQTVPWDTLDLDYRLICVHNYYKIVTELEAWREFISLKIYMFKALQPKLFQIPTL